MDRAELIIKLTGDNEALSSLHNLEKAMKNLNNSKAQLRVDKSLLDREIADVQSQIKKLMQQKNEIRFMGGDTDEITAKIIALQDRLRELTGERKSIQLDTSDINLAASGLEDAERSAQKFYDTLSSAFGVLSDLSQATADFADSIGSAFSSMGSLFKTNVFDYLEQSLTFLATKSLVGDFSKITQRYDIMSTFTQYMEEAGVASDESAAALQRVNDAILGLPIGLDEAAYRLRRYQMFIGDINDATNLTIGLQNALLAGGASDQMRNTAYQQIDRLLSAGKLNTSRQWLALIQGLGVSLRYVTKEMGVANLTTREFASGLTSGRISTSEFLRALMNLGSGTSESAKELDRLLEIYKTTLESWLSNIRFAAVRGGETILKSLNEGLLEANDKGIVDYLRGIRDAMNTFYKGAGGFITGNPQLIRRMTDSIEGLFDSFSRFSASDTASMIFGNLARGVDMLTVALNRLPVKETEQFFAFAVTLAGPLGKLFEVVSSGAPYMIAVFERFKGFNFELLISRITDEVSRMASVYERMLNLLGDGALTELITLGLVYGRPAAAGFGAIADALSKIGLAVMGLNALKGSMAALSGTMGILSAALVGIIGLMGIAQGKSNELVAEYRAPVDTFTGMSREELQQWIRNAKRTREQLGRDVALEMARSDNLGQMGGGEAAFRFKALEEDISLAEDLLAARSAADEAAGSLDAYTNAVTGAASATEEAAGTVQTLESRLVAAQDAISLAGEKLNAVWEKQVDLFAKMEETATVKFSDLEAALESNAKAFISYQENAEKAARFIAGHPELGMAASELFQSVMSGGLEDAGQLAGLVEKFETDYDGFLGYLEEYIKTQELQLGAQDWANILGAGLDPETLGLYIASNYGPLFTEALTTAFAGMGDSLANQVGFDSMLEGMLQGGYGDSAITSKLPEKAQEVGKQFAENVAIGAADADTSEAGQKVAESVVSSTEQALKEVDYAPVAASITEKLTEALTAAFAETNLLSVLFNTEDLTGLQTALTAISETLVVLSEEALQPFNEQILATNEGLMLLYSDAMLPVEELSVLFYDTHVPELNTALLDLISVLDDLVSVLDDVISLLEDARKRSDELRSAVDNLGNTTSQKTPIMQELAGVIDGVRESAVEATTAVTELASAISSLKSTNIAVNAPGLIRPAYRAKGGFIPHGTDTVPAMLTPGEFVMRRSAVKAFGLDFMKRLNSLDVSGMMQALYRNLPSAAGFVPFYNVQNRNDNRNISVNQNIYNSGEQYSYRIANRWAHAL